ncbi:MAG: tripartite tricarboxylate transporter permease [bacterium]|nr:tripartite tricarboxylate transporter permease [bacterium]
MLAWVFHELSALELGIPGSPPAAMLLGALMIHGVRPGPIIEFEAPGFIMQMTAILFLASIAMWVCGMLLSKQVVKILRVPPPLFMPIIGILCVIGSYALGTNIFNLYLMVPSGRHLFGGVRFIMPIPPSRATIGGMPEDEQHTYLRLQLSDSLY